jgi:tetratricopeptide (TPR) repeat protein
MERKTVKVFAFLLLLIILAPLSFAQPDCLAYGKELFSEKEYVLAEESLKTCLSERKGDGDVLISLAGIQMVLGKFTEAENNFKAAARILGPQSPYVAYVNSRLGDIEMRKPNLLDAAFFYDAALKAEPANINALVGKGIIEEKFGRTREAVNLFKKALAVDFTNVVARERLIAMEPDILTYEEVLTSLKERNVVDPAADTFLPEDENMLRKMITAEKDNGITYLSNKYRGRIPAGFVVERDPGKIYVRKMLTLTGYNELIRQISADAKQFFLSKNILPGDIFELKDYDGKMVFDEKGSLTDEGLIVYSKGLQGAKAYVLPGEILPSTQKEIDSLAKLYLRRGHTEISMPEFLHLMRHSRCSEQTLIKDLKVKVINIDSRNKRVFVVSDPREVEPFILPYQYVMDFRRSYNESKKNSAPVYSSAFGLGGGQDVKLCTKDGVLFDIEMKKSN